MAAIRKRSSGNWQVQIRRRRQKPLVKSFCSRVDAKRWARFIESEIDRGLFVNLVEAEQTTLSQILDRYAHEVLPSKKDVTRVLSRIRLIKKSIGDYSLATITSSVVASFRNERLMQVGPQSVKHELSILSRVLNTAMKDWGIALPLQRTGCERQIAQQPR
jgi:hypothetical protein